jgi:4-hydroxy-3-methylbut-2-enyl diphosphate reductase
MCAKRSSTTALWSEELRGKGAIVVDSEDEVPNGERVIYSAHGVSPEVREHSARRGLCVIDATCPLVTKVHVEAVKFAKEGYSLILIGHKDREVDGDCGRRVSVSAAFEPGS